MIIDTHVHLSAPTSDRYPRAVAPPMVSGDYVHTAEEQLAGMAAAGVEACTVVQPFALYGDDNAYHADAAAACPHRMAGVCGLSPFDEEAPASLRYWVRERGMAAVRLNGRAQRTGLDDPRVAAVIEEAQSLGVPVTILLWPRQLPSACALAGRFPRTPILLEHLGGAFSAGDADSMGSDPMAALLACAGTPNLMLKFAMPQVICDQGRARLLPILERFGAERLLWGTNYPPTDLGGYAATVQAGLSALDFLGSSVLDQVLGANACSLWPLLGTTHDA